MRRLSAERDATMQTKGIDATDEMILKLLQKDGRMSYSDIASCVGLSRTAVKARIRSLERCGIIKGYTANIAHRSDGDHITYVINVETTAEDFDECKRILAMASETVSIVQTTGVCHLLAICTSDDVYAMRDFTNRIYKSVSGIVRINVNTVLDVIKGSIIPEN